MAAERLERIRAEAARSRLDALLLTNIVNIRYASGFTGSTATVVITPDRAIILVDFRYALQAAEECAGFEIVQYSADVLKAISELLNEMSPRRLGFEAGHVTYSYHKKLRSLLSRDIRLFATERLIERLRLVKDPCEIEKIKNAVAVVDKTFSHIIKHIKPGMTEREVALEIDTFMRKHGADKPGFDTIVAAGPNAAFPHHSPTDAVLQPGQMVKMDFGAALNGYNSDITRTVFLGQPDEKQREIYNIVLDAQLKAIGAIRPGMAGKDADAVAREYIASKGYGDNFGHGLGHSLGIEVHDGPGLSPSSDTVLAPGMVMTVEPGIYIEGWGGVRIEDDIVVTDSGAKILMKSTKKMIVIS